MIFFFETSKKNNKKKILLAEKKYFVSLNAPSISLPCSGDLKAHFEGSFDILNPQVFEKNLQLHSEQL